MREGRTTVIGCGLAMPAVCCSPFGCWLEKPGLQFVKKAGLVFGSTDGSLWGGVEDQRTVSFKWSRTLIIKP